jgi:hypothetical protein
LCSSALLIPCTNLEDAAARVAAQRAQAAANVAAESAALQAGINAEASAKEV